MHNTFLHGFKQSTNPTWGSASGLNLLPNPNLIASYVPLPIPVMDVMLGMTPGATKENNTSATVQPTVANYTVRTL